MTPSSTDCIPNQLNFGSIKGRKVIADFTGGRITSDAGIVLLADKNKKLKITCRFAECFRDYRDLSYVNYSVHQLLAQRVYGIALGYEDVNDHDKQGLESRGVLPLAPSPPKPSMMVSHHSATQNIYLCQ